MTLQPYTLEPHPSCCVSVLLTGQGSYWIVRTLHAVSTHAPLHPLPPYSACHINTCPPDGPPPPP